MKGPMTSGNRKLEEIPECNHGMRHFRLSLGSLTGDLSLSDIVFQLANCLLRCFPPTGYKRSRMVVDDTTYLEYNERYFDSVFFRFLVIPAERRLGNHGEYENAIKLNTNR
ncbi:hypothetical protein HOLleu_17434 [Holothuria leucospilota]|uniref:Uncharacterized protein n=1 Tax=Holothuria leucospilota TaxID=206669 RepID=A0A9Q1H923_HOLLE|nr:hypothetical protein HOLleu_17434 [Holothuria leucospilota]